MKREIVTRMLSQGEFRRELEFVTGFLRRLGQEEVDVLFGYAWGDKYYPTAKWDYIKIRLLDLIEEVERLEHAKLGRLGDDDLFIIVPALNIEFRFCHESDIHLSFSPPTEISEFFYDRWAHLEFSPTEWEKDEFGKPVVRLRPN